VALCALWWTLGATHCGITLLDGLYDPVQRALIDGFGLAFGAAAYGV